MPSARAACPSVQPTVPWFPLVLRRMLRTSICRHRWSSSRPLPLSSALASRRLTDGISAGDRPPLVPGLAPLTLIDAASRGQETVSTGGSIRNLFGAQAVASLVSRLLGGGRGGGAGDQGGEPPMLTASSIGVICLCELKVVG